MFCAAVLGASSGGCCCQGYRQPITWLLQGQWSLAALFRYFRRSSSLRIGNSLVFSTLTCRPLAVKIPWHFWAGPRFRYLFSAYFSGVVHVCTRSPRLRLSAFQPHCSSSKYPRARRVKGGRLSESPSSPCGDVKMHPALWISS
jgi:hypothetical protein